MTEARATLDTLLADAGGGTTRRWFPGVAGAKLVAKLATRPLTVAPCAACESPRRVGTAHCAACGAA